MAKPNRTLSEGYVDHNGSIPLHAERKLMPEQALCLAILEDASNLILKGVCQVRERRRVCTHCIALEWVRTDDERVPLTFTLCCESIKLEPSWLRNRLLKEEHHGNSNGKKVRRSVVLPGRPRKLELLSR